MTSGRIVGLMLSALLVALGVPPAHAQQPTRIPRIGFLSATSASVAAPGFEVFRQGLRELGYVEGKNIVFEPRYAEGKPDRLGALAAELVRLNVDIIYTSGPADTKAAKGATSTIPIVMAWDNDPVGSGFVASLARPGGNITGSSTFAPELSGKQLELLKETVPRLTSVVVIGNTNEPGNAQSIREIERAAESLGLKLQVFDVTDPKEFETVFRAASKVRPAAGLVLPSPVTNSHRVEMANLAARTRLPVVYWRSEFVDAGGLMSYGASFTSLYRRAATYVDKILKGAKPADLPVEQPKQFELVINLKAAKQIGLTIPPSVRVRADRLID